MTDVIRHPASPPPALDSLGQPVAKSDKVQIVNDADPAHIGEVIAVSQDRQVAFWLTDGTRLVRKSDELVVITSA